MHSVNVKVAAMKAGLDDVPYIMCINQLLQTSSDTSEDTSLGNMTLEEITLSELQVGKYIISHNQRWSDYNQYKSMYSSTITLHIGHLTVLGNNVLCMIGVFESVRKSILCCHYYVNRKLITVGNQRPLQKDIHCCKTY